VLVPESRSERSLDRGLRVAALVGDTADCVFLFERESGRQGSEPGTGSGERGPARRRVVLWSDTAGEFECVPADGAVCPVDEGAELLDPVFSNERVRVLGIAQLLGLEHT
jgi:hypothetical protein